MYTVTLTVTDSDGKKGYDTKVITVNEEPVPEIGNITVSANPESNVPGGKSTITAVVTDTEGDVVPDGTTVYFTTNNGALSAGHANTTNGMANVILNLSNMQVDDTATVTAFIGAVSSNTEVSCIAGLITEEIALSANPESNVPGGVSTITAVVTKKAGGFVVDGTTVYFTTNSGELSESSSNTVNGVATVKLILDDNMQAGTDAKVIAFTLNSEPDADEVTVKCIETIVTIYAEDYTIAQSGNTTITAVVTNPEGVPVDDVIVIFFAKDDVGDDIGTLSPVYCPTNANGIATTTLTLSTSGDIAKVTAKCGSRVSNKITIECK
jgi:adhesin/invasin